MPFDLSLEFAQVWAVDVADDVAVCREAGNSIGFHWCAVDQGDLDGGGVWPNDSGRIPYVCDCGEFLDRRLHFTCRTNG